MPAAGLAKHYPQWVEIRPKRLVSAMGGKRTLGLMTPVCVPVAGNGFTSSTTAIQQPLCPSIAKVNALGPFSLKVAKRLPGRGLACSVQITSQGHELGHPRSDF